jgi:AbrB family looped-hinge helix DNA binding protein
MQTVTISEQGQVVIPIDIRKQLGITPGCQLSLILEDSGLRIEVKQRIKSTHPEDSYGLLVCKEPGERHLAEFGLAEAMRNAKLHLTACSHCESFYSFDDRRFARRAARLPLMPKVIVPTE